MLPMFSLDIETDTSTNGLDPQVAAITDVAVFDGVTGLHLCGPEAEMLAELDTFLMSAPVGLLVTWNGAVFDLPFIDARARLLGVPLSLELEYDPEIPVKYVPTPGYLGGYRYRWGLLDGWDVSPLFAPIAERAGVPHKLKPVARLYGIDVVELDRTRLHEHSPAELREYVLSDVSATWQLAERQLT
jgi:DNA polymerase elongation subunit (family B)